MTVKMKMKKEYKTPKGNSPEQRESDMAAMIEAVNIVNSERIDTFNGDFLTDLFTPWLAGLAEILKKQQVRRLDQSLKSQQQRARKNGRVSA